MGDMIEFREILQIVWRRLWLIVLGTVLVTAVAFVASANIQPIYRAKVTMKVDQPANAPLPYSSITTGENLALTYSKLLRTRPLLEVVITNLGLDTSPEQLRDNLATDLIPETQLLELTVMDTDAQRAADTANEIAFTFISLHNKEKQLENISAFEKDVLAQMVVLKGFIERNQSMANESPILSDLPGQESTSSLLQDALASQQSTYANLLSTYLDIQLTQSQFFNVSVVEPAVPSVRPIRPHIPLYTFIGALLGLSLSVGSVFLLEYLDRSLKTGDEVRQILSRPTLGVIPRLHGAERNSALIAWTAPRSAVSEAFRTLRTNLRFASVDKPLVSMLVASADPGAGKSTIATNLGIVCAQAGLRVVVIDTDLRLPRLHEAFGLGNVTGLTDLLIGNTEDVEAYMQMTKIDNLRVITSGPLPPNPAELLGSKRMEAVLENVSRHADFVILDTPPVLPVTDAAVLAPKVDGVLLVVCANKTQREAVRHAAENLRQVEGNIVGAVLNAVPGTGGRYYRYYGQRKKGLRRWLPRRKNPLSGVWALLRSGRRPADVQE